MAFRESDGQFLWQAVHDKLAAGRANDWPFQGICSSPLVENGIVYYVSNRGEVMAVDADGFRDKTNDGLVKDEKLTRETDADVIWRYDMMEELGVLQHNMANSSPVMFENLIYVSTSNGQDESHVNVPSPKVAGDHRGRQDHRQAGVGGQLGRREDPARPVVVAGGRQDRRHGAGRDRPGRRLGARLRSEVRQEAVGVRPQPEGLGLAEDPQRGDQHAGHPRERRLHRQRPGSRARRRRRPPLRHRSRPSAATSPRPARSGTTATSAARSRPARSTTASCSTPTSAASCTRSTSRPASRYWKHDMFAAIWGSPMVIDGKVYLGDEDGDVTVHGRRQDDEADRGEQHGQLGLLDRGAGQRRDLPGQPQPAVRDRGRQIAATAAPQMRQRGQEIRRNVGLKKQTALSPDLLSPVASWGAAVAGLGAAELARVPRRQCRRRVDDGRADQLGRRRRRGTSRGRPPIPGLAHSSPIVWGDRIYVTTAVAASGRPEVKTGDVQQVRHRLGHRHRSAHLAADCRRSREREDRLGPRGAPGRAADEAARQSQPRLGDAGHRRPLIVALLGSEGLFCFDMDGKQKWRADLGVMDVGLVDDPALPVGTGQLAGDLRRPRHRPERSPQGFVPRRLRSSRPARKLWRTAHDEYPSWATPRSCARTGARRSSPMPASTSAASIRRPDASCGGSPTTTPR